MLKDPSPGTAVDIRRFLFEGSLDDPVAKKLESIAKVVPFKPGDVGLGDVLVLNGREGDTALTIEAARRSLAEGRTIALLRPSEALRNGISSLAGRVFPAEERFVVVSSVRSGDSQETPLVISRIPENCSKVEVSSLSEDGTTTSSSVAIEALPPFEERAGDTVLKHFSELAPAANSLKPPAGVPFGGITETVFDGKADLTCDWIAFKGKQQKVSFKIVADLYVYKETGAHGKFQTVLVLHGSFSPGTLVATGGNGLGFFNLMVEQKATLETEGATLKLRAPVSSDSPIITSASVPLSVCRYYHGHGCMNDPWTAQFSQAYPSSGWKVAPHGVGAHWLYYQGATWNPVQNPPEEFGEWWWKVFDNQDPRQVLPMPDTSLNPYDCTTLAHWEIPNTGKSQKIDIKINFRYHLAALGNPKATNGTNHQLYWYQVFGSGDGYKITINDLQSFVKGHCKDNKECDELFDARAALTRGVQHDHE